MKINKVVVRVTGDDKSVMYLGMSLRMVSNAVVLFVRFTARLKSLYVVFELGTNQDSPFRQIVALLMSIMP